MCGIFGIHSNGQTLSEGDVAQFASEMQHRGPDDSGVWLDQSINLALAHRRLSIVDLSPEGHQPMHSASRRFVITFNGEIYNYLDVKKELIDLGYSFRSTSDTEVMLAAFEEWGISSSLEKFVGMFAFGLWDKRDQVLTIARDRVGEKPLYYGWENGNFVFSSDLAPITKSLKREVSISRDALTQLIRHGYIPNPHSIYNDIFKLPPATFISLSFSQLRSKPSSFSQFTNRTEIAPKPYWSPDRVAESGQRSLFAGSEVEAQDQLERLISTAVKGQMMGDVPVGAFLSGGIDSSTICALMQRHSTRPIKTFSIGFHEKGFDESGHARAVAKHIGSDHFDMFVTPQEMLDVIPKLSSLYSEPFADSSQVPTFLVSKIARQKVTVSLSGDGGDELFGGYTRFLWANRLNNIFSSLPSIFHKPLSGILLGLSPTSWNKLFNLASPILPRSFHVKSPGWKIHRVAELLKASSDNELYTKMFSVFTPPSELVIGGVEPECIHYSRNTWPDNLDFLRQIMWLDQVTYLPDDVLVKVDRAAMGVSLETRVPLLDHRVIEFVWKLPTKYLIDKGETKKILRQILYKYVPRELVDRPKQGFGVPIDTWLKGPLRSWAEDLLNTERLASDGFFNPSAIRDKWQQHLRGEKSWEYLLWNILMFQSWNKETKVL